MLSSKILLVVLLFHTIQSRSKQRGLSLMTTKLIQDSLEVVRNDVPEYVDLKMNLINPGKDEAYWDLDANIKIQLPPEIEINLNVDQLNWKGEYEPTPFTIKKNYCTYMRMDKVVYPILCKKGNFPTKCPVKPGNYFIRNFTVTPKDLPVSVPAGTYRIMFSYNLNGRMMTTVWKGRSVPL